MQDNNFIKRKWGMSLLISCFFSIAVFLSIKMPTEFKMIYVNVIYLKDIFLFLFIWCCSAVGCFLCNCFLDKYKFESSKKILKPIFIYFVIFIFWIMFYLGFYPGNISGDSFSSINQALNHINSTAHPVLFTILVKVCLQTGLFLFNNVNAAIAVFSVVQMLILDGILTYTVLWMQKRNAPLWLNVGSLFYFALNPLIVRFSFTMWKDILFSGVLLLLVLFLYDLALNQKNLSNSFDVMQLIILSILAAFLRNRIIYAVAGIFILLLILYKKYWKRLLQIFLITVSVIFLIQGPLYAYLEIKPSNFAEGQGVSLQQIAAVVIADGDMTDEEKEFINKIIPLEDIPDAYSASTVDTLKFYESFDHNFLNEHSGKYINIWKSIVLKNPWTSIKAWLMTTRGFWGFNVWIEPFAITWPSESLNIHQVNVVEKLTGIDLSYISNGVLVNIGKVPVIRRIFELGSLGWFGIFCCIRVIWTRKYRLLLPLLPLVLLWLVLIASTPIFFEARYMFVYHLALPVLIHMIIFSNHIEEIS